ncbi:ArpU family phage packaging/lysis transcriptional regulator [Priestia megaterium]|jgi:ArpU family phage transcriptional regulator|uniref:ArpU family phage packaging/lysis transcriptional regulator n=1 Tax=Priestia megaterium TaxID=1404 RepID=UPI002E23DDC9|nr:ArpU family phage packaging/lysis transcriptional regulator [Priestia megaterium]MED4284355.1 ArpU family phage packaging/lysis transcriptional regulator [Priestia megaterium]MED4292424.1 ArpU family phage packaging/lysis transcriptional regulator [Priestia megaterium]MED4295131.1 ArpU family phage packaging/lysis transcriptional regulator [Priestia megaterium]
MAAIQTSLLRDVDGKETKVNVEKAFANYRMYMMTVPDDIMPKVTPSYSLVPPSNTNAFHSSTEDAAIKRVDYEIERDNFMQKVQQAVNRLSKRERELIIKTYMTYEDVYVFDVYSEMGISETTYYRIRERAFYKLAFALHLQVFKEVETPA